MVRTTLRRLFRTHLAVPTALAVLVMQATPLTLSAARADGLTAASTPIIVNSLSDDTNTCLTAGTVCLRNALVLAQSQTTPATITFSVSGTITLGSTLTITGTNPITIDGAGQGVVVDGNRSVQVFSIASGTTASLNALTIRNGLANGNAFGSSSARSGRKIDPEQHGGASAIGGGLFNAGTLTITNSTIANNTAVGGDGSIGSVGGGGQGGGLYNAGTLTITNSTISGNSAIGGGGGTGGDGDGGGLYNFGTLLITNSTVAGNIVVGGNGLLSNGAVNGGGLYNSNIMSPITSNLLNLLSTIVAQNTGTAPDIFGSGVVNSLGHNLIGNGTGSGLTAGVHNDQVGTSSSPINPGLDSVLADNGGVTQTVALQPDSPAIGMGDCMGSSTATPPAPAVTVDQRGASRKPRCDVGAYETRPHVDSIGIYRNGTFFLRNSNNTGFSDATVAFTLGTRPYPVVGDWTGNGFDSIGVYDQNTDLFALRNTISAGAPDETFVLGNPNDMPLSGRWQLSAVHAGVGVYRPTNGLLYLKNALTTGFSDDAMVLGSPGDSGVAGDWTGQGFDSPGIYRPATTTFFLSNQVTNGVVFSDITATYGSATDLPITGDWIAQGHDGIGMFRPSNGFVYLKNTITNGFADNSFFYGAAGDVPVAGFWNHVGQIAIAPPRSLRTAPILIAKTPLPNTSPNGISVPGGNNIGG